MIDVHAHAVDPDLPDLRHLPGTFPRCEQLGDGRVEVLLGDQPYRVLDDRSWSAPSRIADMDAEGIDVQVLSPMPATLCHDQPVEGARLLAAGQNEFLARLVEDGAGRFRALGAVPLQSPAAAATELRRCVEDLGLAGAEIGCRVGHEEISDRAYDEFWAAADELAAIVLVHPVDQDVDDRLDRLGVVFGWGMPAETATAAAGLLRAGTLERFPRVRVVLAHGGGALPSVLPRLEHGHHLLGGAASNVRPPMESARRLWCDSLTYEIASLALAAQRFGEEHVVLGTDYPFPAREAPAGAILDEGPARWRPAIGCENPTRLLERA